MPTLYVVEQGAIIRRVSQRIQVTKDDEVLQSCPAFQVDRVVVFGSVQITTQAMVFLLERGIDVGFLSTHGKLRGRLASAESKNAFLRLAQYERFRDEAARVRLGKSFIDGKLRNQRVVLQRHQRNHPEVDFSASIATIERCLIELPSKKTVASVMGVEGGASGAYFRAFAGMLRRSFTFEGRRRHPAPDPVNALLSFGYVMATNELDALIEVTGFDPFIGFLHGLRYGRRSLALDLVEEFRHAVIDPFTLGLINVGQMQPDAFEVATDAGVRLTPAALKRYLAAYEARMIARGGDEGEGAPSPREVMRRQVERLERAVLNDEPYEPYVVR